MKRTLIIPVVPSGAVCLSRRHTGRRAETDGEAESKGDETTQTSSTDDGAGADRDPLAGVQCAASNPRHHRANAHTRPADAHPGPNGDAAVSAAYTHTGPRPTSRSYRLSEPSGVSGGIRRRGSQ